MFSFRESAGISNETIFVTISVQMYRAFTEPFFSLANPSIESRARFVARNMSYSPSRTQANLECMREGRARPIWVWQIWIVNLDAIKSVSPDSDRSTVRIESVGFESAIKAKHYITITVEGSKGRAYRVLAIPIFSFIAEISIRLEIATRPIIINLRSRYNVSRIQITFRLELHVANLRGRQN